MKLIVNLFLMCYWIQLCITYAQSVDQIGDESYQIIFHQNRYALQGQLLNTISNKSEVQLKNKEVKSESDSAQGLFVFRISKNGILSLGGRLHRVVMLVNDGSSRNVFFTDSDQGPSMLRVNYSNPTDYDMTVSGVLEVGIQSNSPFSVSQDNPNPGTVISVRETQLIFEFNKVGKFSFGRGFAAAWVVPEVDLSGTVPAALLVAGVLAPGLKFVDRSNNELSSIRVRDHFVDTERLLLVDRLRYDSPRFAGGMQLSSTIAADSRWDAAFRYYTLFEDWIFRTALTYRHKPFLDIEHVGDMVFSARHNNTGLTLTIKIGLGKASNSREAMGYIVKGGWLANLNSLGATAFSLDYGSASNVLFDGDKAISIGFFALQKWISVGIDLYTGYRRYKVRRPDIDLKPLDTFTFGAILTF